MKNIYLLIALLCSILLFESCRKEKIEEEDPIIKIDPSEEIKYPVVKGLVTNNGNSLPDASVNIFQNEMLVGTVITDQEGKFNTAEYELEKDAKVTFEVSKTEYANAYRRKNVNDLVDNELIVNLVSLSNFDLPPNPVEDPGSTDLISLSGHIKDLLGQPSIAYIAVEWEEGITYFGMSTYPDSEGYYEMLLPVDTEVRLSVSDSICGNYLTEQEVKIFTGLQAEYFGPFSDDVILPDYTNPISTLPHTNIQGTLKDCDGQPVFGGSVTFQFDDNETFNYYIFQDLGNDAVFEFDESRCLKLPYDLTIFGNDYGNNKTTDTISYTIMVPETTISLPDFVACNEGESGISTVTIESDGVTHAFSQTIVRFENGDLISDEFTLNAATFRIPNAIAGLNSMEDFGALNWGTGVAFKAVDATLDLQITTLTAHKAIGHFAGTFLNSNNEEVAANGVIDLNF